MNSPEPRVGYILKMFPRFSETFVVNEILELERQGLRLAIFSMRRPEETLRQDLAASVRAPVRVLPPLSRRGLIVHMGSHLACLLGSPRRYLRTLSFARGRRSRSGWRKFLTTPYVVREARALGVRHFHAHFASGPARQAKLAALMSGLPFSFTAHAKDLFWKQHRYESLHKLKKRVRLASFVITISEHNRRFIHSLGFKVPAGRVVTLHNGLDLERWRLRRPEGMPAVIGDGPPLILGVGRLVRKKGFHNLVRACRLLADRGRPLRCVIAGEGPERAWLEALVSECRLQEIVALAGPVPQDRLLDDLYLRAHVLVQPSIVAPDGDRDGIPTVLLEAMALGLPVVSTPVSGIGEAVVDGYSGLMASPDDVSGLASAIARVLDEPELARRLAQGARKQVESRFDLRQNARVLAGLFAPSLVPLVEAEGAAATPPEPPVMDQPVARGRIPDEVVPRA